jgi:hypothetical protein
VEGRAERGRRKGGRKKERKDGMTERREEGEMEEGRREGTDGRTAGRKDCWLWQNAREWW